MPTVGPLSAVSHSMPPAGRSHIDNGVVREADLIEVGPTSALPTATLAGLAVHNPDKRHGTQLRGAIENLGDPASHVRAHADTQRVSGGTAVANPLSLMAQADLDSGRDAAAFALRTTIAFSEAASNPPEYGVVAFVENACKEMKSYVVSCFPVDFDRCRGTSKNGGQQASKDIAHCHPRLFIAIEHRAGGLATRPLVPPSAGGENVCREPMIIDFDSNDWMQPLEVALGSLVQFRTKDSCCVVVRVYGRRA